MAQKNIRRFDSERFLQNLKTGSKAVEYKKKNLIFVQRDSAQAVFYIRKGRVKPPSLEFSTAAVSLVRDALQVRLFA